MAEHEAKPVVSEIKNKHVNERLVSMLEGRVEEAKNGEIVGLAIEVR